MKSRRDFLKTTASVAVALPLANIAISTPVFARGGGGGKVDVQDINIIKYSRGDIGNRLRKKILDIIRRQLKGEDSEQLQSYLKKNPKALSGPVDKIAKQLKSGKYDEIYKEKPAGIKISFKFGFKPPDKFEISLKIEL